jgi:hypothetical protein
VFGKEGEQPDTSPWLACFLNPDPPAMRDLNVDAERGDEIVGRTVSINRSRAELYTFWRDFRNFPERPSSPLAFFPIRSRRMSDDFVQAARMV